MLLETEKIKTSLTQVGTSVSSKPSFPLLPPLWSSDSSTLQYSVFTQESSAARLSIQPDFQAEEETGEHSFSGQVLYSLCSGICQEAQCHCTLSAWSWLPYHLRNQTRWVQGTWSSSRAPHTPNCRQPSQDHSSSGQRQENLWWGSSVLIRKTTLGIPSSQI